MLKAYTFPRAFTYKYTSLDDVITETTQHMIAQLQKTEIVELKPVLLKTCANIFLSHFCSQKFSWDDPNFVKMVENFDEVFYEVNQGYAADFLPFLMPFYQKMMQVSNFPYNF